ncbi:hypothetical protein [Pyxidicoccus caerfyrddinensis]|uniref:hypothetical protein n=1 Tax=Pyxidicoccus caerfyrddinensis TaxID=2709663 RepID=UPI0013D9E910|nr:hypothetical protein [Pyxidicoccus caerfyrddinensis]
MKHRVVGSYGMMAALVLGGSAANAETMPTASDGSPGSRPEQQTLLGGDFEHGGYGGPSATYSRMLGSNVLLVGGRGAWLLDGRFGVGGAVNGLIPMQSAFPVRTGERYDLRLGYGGLWLEYVFTPHRVLHSTVGVLLGGGWLGRRHGEFPGEETLGFDALFAVEPTVTTEVNVLSFFRVGAGISYRYLGGVDLEGMKSSDLSNFAGTLFFKFGSF